MENHYCCFWCPEKSDRKRSLGDSCPRCKRPYEFPLSNMPKKIGDYRIVKPLDRGFFGATYLAEWGNLHQRQVVKVVSKDVYKFFEKDFVHECELHNRVAEGTDHVVRIRDYFDAEVQFGDSSLNCYVAILAYVEGDPLSMMLKEERPLEAKTVAQIAIDLYRIFHELNTRSVSENLGLSN